MKEEIRLKATEDTPKVVLAPSENHFEITGRSLPEDAPKFFEPILNWLDEYVQSPNPNTKVYMNLDYYNSSSIKELIRVLMTLEKIKKTGKKVKVIWYYHEEDELMETRGKEIKTLIDIPFEIRHQ